MTVDLDPGAIPEELAERKQWICVYKGKRPIRADGETKEWQDFQHWVTLEEATEAAESNGWDGVGFVFSDGGPYVGLDLDNCLRDDGGPKDWLPGLDSFVGETYIQRSQSGRGLHVLLRDVQLPGWWTNLKDEAVDGEEAGVEAYDAGRFFRMTGDRLEESTNAVGSVDPAPFLADAHEEIKGGPPTLPGGDDRGGEDVDVSIYDLLSKSTYPEGENRPHPEHGSDTGTNFRVDPGGETFRCWRHGVTGSALHLLGIREGIIHCGDWRPNGLDTDTWREIFDAAREAGVDVPERQTAHDGGTAAVDAQEQGGDLPGNDFPMDLRAVVAIADYDPEEKSPKKIDNNELGFALANMIERSPDHHIRVMDDDTEELFAFDNDAGFWRRDGERYVKRVSRDVMGKFTSGPFVRELIHQIESHPDLSMDRDRFGGPEGYLPTPAGLVNIQDPTERRSALPEDYLLGVIATEYDETAEFEGSRFQEFLEESVKPRDLDKLQEYAGLCLWHTEQRFKKACFLIGPTDSGKGTFLRAIEAVLGTENVAHQSLKKLTTSRWATDKIYGKWVNLRNEVTPGGLKNVQLFKELTGGGDTVDAEDKGTSVYEFEVKQKFMFSTNRFPEVKDADDAFFNRCLFVEFPETVPTDELDPDLDDDLADEAPVILNWMIEGLQRLLANGHFSNELTIEEKKAITKSFGSPITQFVYELLEVTGDSEDVIHKKELYNVFSRFCDFHEFGETPVQRTFTTEMKSKSGISEGQSRKVRGDDSKQPDVFKGGRIDAEGCKRIQADLPRHATSDDDDRGDDRTGQTKIN